MVVMCFQGSIPQLINECIEQGLKLHDLERELIIVALEKYQDKRSVAANKLGIPVYTLYKKIKKFQIKKFNSFPVIKKDVSLSAAKSFCCKTIRADDCPSTQKKGNWSKRISLLARL
jgi:hypothetical protein